MEQIKSLPLPTPNIEVYELIRTETGEKKRRYLSRSEYLEDELELSYYETRIEQCYQQIQKELENIAVLKYAQGVHENFLVESPDPIVEDEEQNEVTEA